MPATECPTRMISGVPAAIAAADIDPIFSDLAVASASPGRAAREYARASPDEAA